MILGNEVTASQNRYWRIYIKYELRYSQKTQGCPEPKIAVEDITIDIENISIIGQNKDTIRFNFNGITYIKFKAKKLIEELNTYRGRVNMTVVGKSTVNRWNGTETPQIQIEEIEIKENSIYDF